MKCLSCGKEKGLFTEFICKTSLGMEVTVEGVYCPDCMKKEIQNISQCWEVKEIIFKEKLRSQEYKV